MKIIIPSWHFEQNNESKLQFKRFKMYRKWNYNSLARKLIIEVFESIQMLLDSKHIYCNTLNRAILYLMWENYGGDYNGG